MRMKATIEVEFEGQANLDEDTLRAALLQGVRELEKVIKQGTLGGSGVKWVNTKIHDAEVWGISDGT